MISLCLNNFATNCSRWENNCWKQTYKFCAYVCEIFYYFCIVFLGTNGFKVIISVFFSPFIKNNYITHSTPLFPWSWLNEGINSPTWSPNVHDNFYHIFLKIVITEFLLIPLSQTPCVGVTKGTFNFGDDYYTLVLYYNYSYKPFHTHFTIWIYLLLYDVTSIIMFLDCFSLSFNELVSIDPLLINNHVNHIHCIHTCTHKHT